MTAKAAIRAAPRCPQPMMTPHHQGELTRDRVSAQQKQCAPKRAHFRSGRGGCGQCGGRSGSAQCVPGGTRLAQLGAQLGNAIANSFLVLQQPIMSFP
jgi:hypothetical protein